MRPIDADALKEKIDDIWNGRPLSFLGARLLAMIDSAPTIDPKTKVVAQVTFDEDKLREIVHEAVERIKEEYDIVDGWIPCSDHLPTEGEIVLVCMKIECHKAEWEEQRSIEFGRISSDRYDYDGTGWEWLNESGADYWQADWDNSILAWMPLPKPWKGADDE